MRELLTVIAIAILLAVGWKQSFQSHWYQLIGKSTPGPAARPHGIGPVNSAPQAGKETR